MQTAVMAENVPVVQVRVNEPELRVYPSRQVNVHDEPLMMVPEQEPAVPPVGPVESEHDLGEQTPVDADNTPLVHVRVNEPDVSS